MGAEVIGVFALGWLFSQWMNSEYEPTNAPSEDEIPSDDPQSTPPVPVSPDSIGKPLFYIESVYTSQDGLEVVYCLYQLEGSIVEYPDSGEIVDSSSYVKVGHIIGNSSGTGFVTEPSGGYDFVLDGVEYTNVTIYTKSDAIARVDEQDDDPTSPQKPDEDEPEYTPPTMYEPDYGFGGMRRGGVF